MSANQLAKANSLLNYPKFGLSFFLTNKRSNKMKTLATALFLTIFTIQLSAQDNSFSKSGNHSMNHFYIDLVGKTATLNGDWGLFGGLRVGYNIDDNFSIGLIGHGLIPEKLGGSYINKNGRDELHLGYAGIETIYKLHLSDKFFLTGNMMVGAGRADYEFLGGDDYFFIIEPGVSVNYKLTDWFGLGYAINYRQASGVKYADFSNASFSGWSTNLDFKFDFNIY